MQVNGLHYSVPAAAATMAVTPDTPYEDIPTPDKLKPLFEPVKVGAFQLDTKVVYAPLTRCRAERYIPADITAQYYSGERFGSAHLHVLPPRCCAAYPPADPGQRGQLTCPDCCLIITFVHQTTRSGIGLIAAEPHGSTAGATKGGTAGGVFRRPPLALFTAIICSVCAHTAGRHMYSPLWRIQHD